MLHNPSKLNRQNKFIHPFRGNLAFTLIELLVVIAIVGILSGIIMMTMSGSTESARLAKLQVFGNSMRDILGANLLGEWRLDSIIGASAPYTTLDTWGGNSGTLTDTGGACSFTGTLYCPQLVTSGCPSGTCMSFDGTGDYIDLGNKTAYNFSNRFTLSAWIKTSVATGTTWIVSRFYAGGTAKRGIGIAKYLTEFCFQTTTDGLVGTIWSYTFTGTTITDNTWHYVAASYDKTNLYLYVDGVKQTYPETRVAFDSDAIFTIGKQSSDNVNYFNGLIDDVRMYNSVVPTSQIRENYVAGLNKLLANNGITKQEYDQRITKLSQSYAEK